MRNIEFWFMIIVATILVTAFGGLFLVLGMQMFTAGPFGWVMGILTILVGLQTLRMTIPYYKGILTRSSKHFPTLGNLSIPVHITNCKETEE